MFNILVQACLLQATINFVIDAETFFGNKRHKCINVKNLSSPFCLIVI